MTFMSAIDVGNDTRPVPPRGGKEPGRKQFIEKRNPAPVSGRAAHASGYGGGKSIIIPSGQLFAWQSAGGGTRDQIYGRWARLYIALGMESRTIAPHFPTSLLHLAKAVRETPDTIYQGCKKQNTIYQSCTLNYRSHKSKLVLVRS